jgi:diadenosine tetraphosphatase ApaH/serine/threonine PP2A family protein phosphatase
VLVAVLSDIHANLEALQAVLDDMKSHGAEGILGLGDYIGFNGNPAECLSLVQPHLLAAVQGNHEAALMDRAVFGVPMYMEMMDRTQDMLSAEQLRWLRRLPNHTSWQDCMLGHATPEAPKRWGRIANVNEARKVFASVRNRISFYGHTHRPAIFCEKEGKVSPIPVVYNEEGSFTLPLQAECRYLINPGSVGQPRDLDYRAAYGLYDTENATLTLRRVDYDVDAAAANIARTGLPDSFAADLKRGHSPTGD